MKLILLASSGSLASAALAEDSLPSGAQIVSGQGAISESGQTMTVTQLSDRMIANWQSFSIGAGHAVNFIQPGASSVALNRVVGQDPSQILGSLNANGQVFLVNPNGVMIGKGAQVQTGGGFLAATLDIQNRDFLAGTYRFTGTRGAITNEGEITGNVVALIAPNVVNDGAINGSTALAAGTNVLLDFAGDGLLSVEVSGSTVATLVENNGLIRADGGVAILTAKGASDALKGVVNNSGTVQARTLASRNGRILLLADMEHGDTTVGGTLDASAPNGGDGGFIETSARNVRVADDVHLTTQAASGEQGNWLIDPNDFTIAASGGNTTGHALSNVLAFTNVTIDTTTQGTPGGNGNIFVNDSVSWAANTLTLSAERHIFVNTAMNGSGTAGLALWYGQGAPALNNNAVYEINAPVNLAATGHFATRLGSDGAIKNYTIVTALGNAGSSNDGSLQGIRGDLTGNYVLGADINAAGTISWVGGFTPIGGNGTVDAFTGTFDGLGHAVQDLRIERPSTNYIGLFGITSQDGIVRNVGLPGARISGNGYVGGLAGVNGGTIADAYSNNAAGVGNYVGGLVGYNMGSISRSYTTGGVASFGDNVGGLVGFNFHGLISQSHALGEVTGGNVVGGLVGYSLGTIVDSHATGRVVGAGGYVGGLVGGNDFGKIYNSYATGSVAASSLNVGGLVGSNDEGTIGSSYATGAVLGGGAAVGGLVGKHFGGWVNNSFATGSVSGASQVGGLIGLDEGDVNNVYATGVVTGGPSTGGLVGHFATSFLVSGFYDAERSGQRAACGTSTGGSCGATGLTTQQMKNPFSFIDAGWDFSSTWGKSRVGENDGYMVLRVISDTEYNYYVRLSDVTLQRTYGGANPNLSTITLDGVGAANVTLGWGSAVTANTHAGTYAFSGANVLNPQLSAGTAADYYFDYGSGALSINRAALIGTVNNSSVTYDGQAFAGGNGITWSGFVAGDDASHLAGSLVYGGTAQGARNAGVYSLTASGLSSSDYDVSYRDGALTIDRRVVSATGRRVYDGTAAIGASDLTLDNLVSGETLTLSGVGVLDNRNAGSGKALTLGSLTLGDGSGLASNYILTGGAHAVDVSRRAISVTSVAANDKVYDGTTAATLNINNAHFGSVVTGDDVVVARATGAFSDKNVGNGKAVSVTGVALGGADAGNYTLASTVAAASASITPKEIAAVTGITADDKTYDGTTAATLHTNGANFSGIVAGDVLSVTSANGAFSDRQAGIGKRVNITGLVLGGADASNYTLKNAAIGTTASISPRAITAIDGIVANDRTYDGSTVATLDTGRASFLGALPGDALEVASARARFASAAPAQNVTVFISDLTLGGADAGNYTLTIASATTTASINAIVIPPLQPDQGASKSTGDITATVFPSTTHEIFANPSPLIDIGMSDARGSDSDAQPESLLDVDCRLPKNASRPECTASPPMN